MCRRGVCCFHRMENRPCRAWKPRADGERLGLIGAAASMEAGHRRSMLEARPFAVRTAALAHGLCGYVQVAAAEGPACIVAAQPAAWLPFVVRQKLAGGWKALWLRDKGKWKSVDPVRTEQLLAAAASGSEDVVFLVAEQPRKAAIVEAVSAASEQLEWRTRQLVVAAAAAEAWELAEARELAEAAGEVDGSDEVGSEVDVSHGDVGAAAAPPGTPPPRTPPRWRKRRR